MNLGQWLGHWAGDWFGAVEEDPNALSGTGTVARFTATADLTLSGAPEPQPEPGFSGGLPWRPYKPRRIEEDEALLMALRLA